MIFSKPTWALAVAIAAATAMAIYGARQFRFAQEATAEAHASRLRQEQTAVKIAVLEGRLRAESDRAAATEHDNATLTAAIEKAKAAQAMARVTAPATLTHEAVRTRYERARELVKSGDPAEALRELLWCFDEGMVGNSSYAGVRSSYVLSAIMELGRQNPAAVTALRERRDKAKQRILAGGGDGGEIPDLTALNRVLGENQLTLSVFDQLPLSDRRRQTMAIYASELLRENHRYRDVLVGRSYASMSSQFELTTQERPVPANAPEPEKLRSASRSNAIATTVKNIEVLAGAGDLVHARELTGRLLSLDNSEATKALLLKHLTRAGHPELMKETGK